MDVYHPLRWRAQSHGEQKKLSVSVLSNDPAAAGEWVVENEPSVTRRKALDLT